MRIFKRWAPVLCSNILLKTLRYKIIVVSLYRLLVLLFVFLEKEHFIMASHVISSLDTLSVCSVVLLTVHNAVPCTSPAEL